MKVEKIKYSKYYHPIQSGEWIGIDGILEEGEDVLAAFAEARKITKDAFEQGQATVTEIQIKELKSQPTGNVVDDIKSCEDLVVLDSYKLLVEAKKNEKPEWKEAYDKRRSELYELLQLGNSSSS